MDGTFRVLVLHILTVWTAISCIQCPSSCSCYWNDGSVNCSNLNTFPTFQNSSLIKNLDLRQNNITRLLENDLSQYPELLTLDLRDNFITEIPTGAFSMLPNLSWIDLSGNKISKLESGVFCNLTSLNKLFVSRNAIKVIDSKTFHGLPNLELLDLSTNGLEDIKPDAFHDSKHLQYLRLHDNSLTRIPSDMFYQTPNLKSLYMENNKIRRVENFAFSALVNPHRIVLTNNLIWDMGPYSFQKNHTDNTLIEVKVKQFYISNNKLKSVPSALNDLIYATLLNISQNHFSSIPVDAFNRLSSLVDLRISHIKELRRVDSLAFKGLKKLRDLTISNCPNLREIPDGTLQYSKNLQNLFLHNNALETLPYGLLDWHQLTILQLAGNNLKCDCNLKWMHDYSKWRTTDVHSEIQKLQCTTPSIQNGTTVNVVDVNFSTFDCIKPITVFHNRILTGLVGVIVTLVIIIFILVFIKYRRKWVFKYRQFKYSRHKNDGLYTINTKYSDLNENEDIPHGDTHKDDENLI